jgi:hypothetical protein
MPPTGDSDDDWAELARELSRDKPQPLPEPEPPTEELGLFGEGAEELPATAEEQSELPDGAVEAEGEGPPDGQPGTGRKRRRRRRRRRRGGDEQPAEGTAAIGEREESEKGEELEPAAEGFSEEDESDADLVPFDEESSSDEDAGEELLRDLIANWNVPSWDDVVAGLYRPER